MKKLFTFFLINLISLATLGEQNAEKEDLQKQEDSMLYFRDGKSIVSYENYSQSSIVNSLGYLTYSGNFIYGAEFTSNYIKDSQLRFFHYQGVLGYRHLWTKKFLPYVLVMTGYSSFKEESKNLTADGISKSIDLGADIYKNWRIKTSLGVKTTLSNYSSQDIKSANFTDLYVMIGFVF